MHYISMEVELTSSGFANGYDFDNATVVNPGYWFGKTYLINCSGSLFIVEGHSEYDAIDEFASSKYGHMILVPEDIVEDAIRHDYLEDFHHTDSGWVDLNSYFSICPTDTCVYQIRPQDFNFKMTF